MNIDIVSPGVGASVTLTGPRFDEEREGALKVGGASKGVGRRTRCDVAVHCSRRRRAAYVKVSELE